MSPLPPFDPAIFAPDGDRAALRIALRHHWAACRDRTLALFDQITDAQFCPQLHSDYSPLGWHLGHIGWTEELWILQQCAGEKPLDPTLNRLFAADSLPKAERQQLPDRGWILDYLAEVRSRVFAYLDRAPVDHQARLWVWLLQHESQHNETVAFLHSLRRDAPSPPPDAPLPDPEFASVTISAGAVVVGSDRIDAQDNERPAQRVWVDSFECDRFPVTQGQYQAFIAADGYQTPDYWSAAGWQWRTAQAITQPLHWQPDPAWQHHPVCGISYYEAEAYARFVGKRLPTEWEWEKVAGGNGSVDALTYPWGDRLPEPYHGNFDTQIGHTTAVNAYPQGQSKTGCWDLLGNVWEWTATPFAPYPGFEPYPYRGYSAAYFDGQHQVMRGGSWATRPWGLRNSFRNWYQPWVREIFVGMRLVRSL
jgi:ergothioneine biosynthesis protein EgtB